MPNLEGTLVQALLILGVQMGSPGCSLRLYVLVLDCLCLAAFYMSRRTWAVPGWPQAAPVERELSRPSHNNLRSGSDWLWAGT